MQRMALARRRILRSGEPYRQGGAPGRLKSERNNNTDATPLIRLPATVWKASCSPSGRIGDQLASVAAALSESCTDTSDSKSEVHRLEELQRLVALLPDRVRSLLEEHPDLPKLVEVVMDLGRSPIARFPDGDVQLCSVAVTSEDLDQAVRQVGEFDADNRAGINQTLHRISCMRNRAGRIVGLTCRVGRVIEGSAALVEDFIKGGRSILLLGRPGVGKTTAIRDISCMLANIMTKRTVIVDTSNEIGGDGDVPHPGIGDARRMQVPCPEEQHRVMQEAVENHMPQAIIIDEIGTESECMAARTISQRGVQLVATAHGNALENVIKNPSLNLLVGGIQSVTLGDDAAKRRGVQKSVLERAGPPTFDVCVEMIDRNRWKVHPDVGLAVDAILAGGEPGGVIMRERDPRTGKVRDVSFKGVVRRVDEHGDVHSMELWVSSDGYEFTRPIAPTEPAQSLPLPSSSSSSSPVSARPESSSSQSSNSSSSSSSTSRGGIAGMRSALDVRPSRQQDDSSPPLRRPLPSLLVVPDPPLSAWTVGNNLGSTTGQAKAAAASAAVRAAAAKLDGPSNPNTQSQPLLPVSNLPPDGWERPAKSIDDDSTAARPSKDDTFAEAAGMEAGARSTLSEWPSAAAAAASLPVVMPPPVLDTSIVVAAAEAAAASATASMVRPQTASPARLLSPERQTQSKAEQTAPAGPTTRVYLFMDDVSAFKVQQTIAAEAGSSTVIMTQDLAAAHVVVATRSKLRSSPKMKFVVRKLGKPIYTIHSTSTSRILRDLCPVLGINPLASVASGSDASDSSFRSQHDMQSGSLGLEASSSPEGTAPLSGRGGVELSGADDYAQLMDSMVRELRYAPIDRDYSSRMLDSFLEELSQPQLGSESRAQGRFASGVSASSLATMAWALSYTKHKRKFVEAKRPSLLGLAAECSGHWDEFSSRDLLRLASGMAGLRLAPGGAWVEELVSRCNAGMAAGEFSDEQVERLTAAIHTLESLVEVSEMATA